MEDASDLELWERAASGSDAAFGALFERHASAVYNYCFRRVGNWSAAEDLMSATFLEAWRRRDEVRLTRDSLRPWLLGVATNLLRNDLRSRRRRDAALQRVVIDSEESSFADHVAARVDDERRMKDVLRVLPAMSKDDQDVIVLSEHAFDHWTAEVATGDYEGRECANALWFQDAERKVLIIPTFRGDGIDPNPFGTH